ncbi:MAG: DNA topoisomerase IB [Actinobacteria bacterium]|nr:DNA topoisomerase IB [Actinomycetota bacterium]
MRLTHSDCSTPGITRRRAGKGFTYWAASGKRVTDADTLARISALAVPPAWTDVWICPRPNGHIQAVGFDDRGRRQYRYHDEWRTRRDGEKFDRMLDFARALPRLREVCDEYLAGRGLTRERVTACAVRLLDLGFFRIGTEEYAKENDTRGLATMRKADVTVAGDLVTFDYKAKGGKRQVQSVVDADVATVVAALKRRKTGRRLFAVWEAGRWVDLKANDVNQFIKEHAGEQFSAKDFRTWNATVLAAIGLAVSANVTAPTSRKRAIRRAVCEVANYLGNTPTVCRTAYIDPRVVDCYEAGETVNRSLIRLVDDDRRHEQLQGELEKAVLRMLQRTRSAKLPHTQAKPTVNQAA